MSINVGIEAMNIFAGSAYLNVNELAKYRQLDMQRFENLLMVEKTVALHYEDPISFGVNAAKPIIDSLSSSEKDRIEMLITCTESAFDFGKSMSTYFHELLELNRNCRLFELKNACYSGTAGLQMAINFVATRVSPGAKALVIATDVSRFFTVGGGEVLTEDWSFAEPSGGAGAVAMLISETPHLFQVDFGANGYYGYQVMDTCRPTVDGEAGDSDLSLLSYLNCCENSFLEYKKRVSDVEYTDTFDYLVFHTPFGGMIHGAHRMMMRKFSNFTAKDIQADFEKRVTPGLALCQLIGNAMGATAALSLASTILHGDFDRPRRVGCFSYGSGCCSEFYSGIVTKEGQTKLAAFDIESQLHRRYRLSLDEYLTIISGKGMVGFGARNIDIDTDYLAQARQKNQCYLKAIKEFHREYEYI